MANIFGNKKAIHGEPLWNYEESATVLKISWTLVHRFITFTSFYNIYKYSLHIYSPSQGDITE